MTAYALGVDLGTTYTAAAVARGASSEPLPLGTDSAQVPSVVVIRDTGEVLVGDAAERRAALEPLNTAREFKRRLGDPVPFVLAGQSCTVESLMGHVLRWVVARATEQEGEPPTVVVLTHPANYYGYKVGALKEAARLAGLDPARVLLLTEPEAAAISYARQQRIEPGEVVALYDFGGGTFDAAVLRRTGDRFELVGQPEGMERLGGIDFDQAIMAYVDEVLGGRLAAADMNDPQARAGLTRLRSECRRAKEALSTDTDTQIPVAIPGAQGDVRLTRAELDEMVRPRIAETVHSLQRAVASAGIGLDQVSRILLVGGTSRMPIVADQVRRGTGRPVGLDAHPKLSIAVGAGLAGAAALPAPMATAPGAPGVPGAATTPSWQPPAPAPTPTGPLPFRAPPPAVAPKSRKRLLIGAGVGVGVGAAAVAVVLSLQGGSSSSTATTLAPVITDAGVVPPVGTTSPGVTPATSRAGVTTVPAGSGGLVDLVAFGAGAPGGVPGPAVAAGVSGITALAVDAKGDVFVATPEGQVLQSSGGQVVLVGQLDAADGAPGGLAVTGDGSVLVSVPAGIRSLKAGASTLLLDAGVAGLGSVPGPLALDGAGNLYLADNGTHRIIRRAPDGQLSLVAGTGSVPAPGTAEGDGQKAGTVAFGDVAGLVVDRTGNLLVADATALTVRRIAPDGVVSTLAGGGSVPMRSSGALLPDGRKARDVGFGTLDGIAVDAQGRVYVADAADAAVVRIGTDGLVKVVVAQRDGVTGGDHVGAGQATVTALGSIVADRFGSLFFEDGTSLRRITGL